MNSYHLKRVPARPDTNLGPPPQKRLRNPVARWVMMGLLALLSLGSVMPTASLADETIDVMVVYTKSAAATSSQIKIDGIQIDNIDELISQLIANTNKSYSNSGVTQQLRKPVVYKGQVSPSYDESKPWDSILKDLKDDQIALVDKDNQIVGNVHELRDRHKADVVVLLVDKAKDCGKAYQMAEDDGKEFAGSAFAVVNVNQGCLKGGMGGYAFAQQLGHLMGCTDDQGYKPTGFTCTIMKPRKGLCGYITKRCHRTLMKTSELSR
ncbi:MAG: hypothetical protein B6247_29865 [Candidatus Parabeggiatoa sp. nov. 2]|nr:MAG: hypothetical protein B6247_29865 [Beggiatoa sp. 4572_84]